MRDPDLVVRAQLAAAALEGAWHRWRVVHGLAADPIPTVSSYVGYSLEEPWGQPRVVFGLAAEDAEQLAALLERHDCVGPVYAAVATLQGAREVPSAWKPESRFGPLLVPRQAAAAGAEEPQADLPQPGLPGSLFDLAAELSADPGDIAECDEPVFRQAAAAMAEAAAAAATARERADGCAPGSGDDASDAGAPPGVTAGDLEPGSPERRGDDPLADASEADDELTADGNARMGSLAQAASAARAEAEARIRAALTDYRYGNGEVTQDLVFPRILATDVLDPLPSPPRPEVASGAYIPPAAAAPESAGDDRDCDDHGDDAPVPGSQELSSGGSRRGKAARGYQIPRLSRTKRPGSVPDAGQPAT